MVRDFPNSTDQPDEIGLTIYLSGVLSRFSLKRSGNGGFIQMVSNVPPFQSELEKKRSTSGGTPQFPNGITGKLRYHLTEISGFFDQMVNTVEKNFRNRHERDQDTQQKDHCALLRFVLFLIYMFWVYLE